MHLKAFKATIEEVTYSRNDSKILRGHIFISFFILEGIKRKIKHELGVRGQVDLQSIPIEINMYVCIINLIRGEMNGKTIT